MVLLMDGACRLQRAIFEVLARWHSHLALLNSIGCIAQRRYHNLPYSDGASRAIFDLSLTR